MAAPNGIRPPAQALAAASPPEGNTRPACGWGKAGSLVGAADPQPCWSPPRDPRKRPSSPIDQHALPGQPPLSTPLDVSQGHLLSSVHTSPTVLGSPRDVQPRPDPPCDPPTPVALAPLAAKEPSAGVSNGAAVAAARAGTDRGGGSCAGPALGLIVEAMASLPIDFDDDDDDHHHSPAAMPAATQTPTRSDAPSGFRSPAAHITPATPGQRPHRVTPASAVAAVAQRKVAAAVAAAADDPYAFPDDDDSPVSFSSCCTTSIVSLQSGERRGDWGGTRS